MKKGSVTIVVIALSVACLMGVPDASEQAREKPVWGNTFNGVALSVNPAKGQYNIGEPIEIMVLIKNFGEADATVFTVGGFLSNHRLALFEPNGVPVSKSEHAEQMEASVGAGGLTTFTRTETKIKPEEALPESFSLNDWFKLDNKGTYYLVVMRRLRSWDKGFVISNMAKILVVK